MIESSSMLSFLLTPKMFVSHEIGVERSEKQLHSFEYVSFRTGKLSEEVRWMSWVFPTASFERILA